MSIKHKRHDELGDVYSALTTWGLWQRCIRGPKLDIVNADGVYADEFESDLAEMVERLLLIVKQQRPAYYKVLEQEYYFESNNSDGAFYCGMSVRQYTSERTKAESYFAGLLDFNNSAEKKVA